MMWTNVAESVLTGDWQSFTMTQTTTGFGDDQVVFCLIWAVIKVVNLDDDVSVLGRFFW